MLLETGSLPFPKQGQIIIPHLACRVSMLPRGKGIKLQARAGLVVQVRIAQVTEHGMSPQGPGNETNGKRRASPWMSCSILILHSLLILHILAFNQYTFPDAP